MGETELWERTEYCETKWRIWERSEDYKRERLVGKNRKFGEKMGNFIKVRVIVRMKGKY